MSLTITSSDPGFIEVTNTITSDINGRSSVNVTLSSGNLITLTESKVRTLESQMFELLAERELERELINKHPGLKDLYEQYRTMMILVKDNN